MLATIPPPPLSGFDIGPFDLRLYGLLIALGALAALLVTTRRYAAAGGDPELAERAGLVALVFGFVGARLAYVLPRLDVYLASPLDILAIWQGGLALFGGLTVGAIGTIWYVRSRGGDVPAMADAVAPAIPLAQAIGRWGNYFNQELYGRPTDVPWALEVELPFRRPGFEAEETFHPTFLYESLWNLVLVGVLVWLGRRGRLRRGSLFLVYLVGYGIGRGWIEALRVDTAERYLGLSRNNWMAIAVVLIGLVGLWWRQRRSVDEADEESTDADGAVTATATGDTDEAAGSEPAGGDVTAPDEAGTPTDDDAGADDHTHPVAGDDAARHSDPDGTADEDR